MPTVSTHIYSEGSLTGALPFTEVIRSLLKTITGECVAMADSDESAYSGHRGRYLSETAER